MVGTKKGSPGGKNTGGGFNDAIGSLGSILQAIENLTGEGGQLLREERFTTTGGAQGVCGISVRMGIGGNAPVVEVFGNVHSTDEGVVVSKVREPLVDVFDEGRVVVVVAEIPGVADSDIHVKVSGDVLELKAEAGKRAYEREIMLPGEVDPDSMQRSYLNGCLELRFERTSEPGGRADA